MEEQKTVNDTIQMQAKLLKEWQKALREKEQTISALRADVAFLKQVLAKSMEQNGRSVLIRVNELSFRAAVCPGRKHRWRNDFAFVVRTLPSFFGISCYLIKCFNRFINIYNKSAFHDYVKGAFFFFVIHVINPVLSV